MYEWKSVTPRMLELVTFKGRVVAIIRKIQHPMDSSKRYWAIRDVTSMKALAMCHKKCRELNT